MADASQAAAMPGNPGGSLPTLVALWSLTALLSLASLVLTIMGWGHFTAGDAASQLGGCVAGLYYASLGALIVRRARNFIGWLMSGLGLVLALETFGSAWAIVGLLGLGALPAPRVIGLLSEWAFVPVILGFLSTFVLFPTGRLPSRRWRPLAWLGLLVTMLTLTGFLIHPRLVGLPAPGGFAVSIPNPIAVNSLGSFWSTVLIGTPNGLAAVSLPFFIAAVVAMVVRFRAGDREMRQQIKWVAFMVTAQLAAQVVALLGLAIHHGNLGNQVTGIAFGFSAVIALAGMPLAVTLAVLKYRLYQIDVIINKAVKYGLLSVALTAVYAAIVVGIGTLAGYVGGPLLTVAAAVAIAVLFHPVRERAQLVANRLVYGQVAAPYHVLADRNAQLTAELRATIADLTASRQRLVRAQDEERHRIERNLHDGAQQHLVALAMMLRVLEDAGDLGEVKQMAAQLRDSVHAALEDLRSLARGIYPPLLADQGLPPALRAQAVRAPLPVTVEADGIGRYRRDIEATAYFCVLEALQNVAKYARASQATVTLASRDGDLEFTVTDNGAGFDPAATPRGTGLQGMQDRLAAADGTLTIHSIPGQGTTISARLPAHSP